MRHWLQFILLLLAAAAFAYAPKPKEFLPSTPAGQRASMVDASGTNIYAYDSRDRLLTNATPQGTLVYSYDLFGNLASIQSLTSGGISLRYGYDALNRLTNVTDLATGTTNAYGFDAVGNLQTVRYANGVTNHYAYDALNRLTNLVAGTPSAALASFAYRLGPAGHRTNLVETIGGVGRAFTWSYDALYRLTNEVLSGASPTGTISYRYDAVGNRTNRTSTVSGITNQTFAYTANDWLATDVYDANGSTRTNGANVFFYDPENRLTDAVVGGVSVSYTYNADGIRVSKTTGGVTTLYLVDDRNPTGYAQVLEELTVSGGTTNLTKVYTYGQDLIAQRIVSSGQRSFYGYDGNGNTRYLTGTNAAITDTYVYDAFGTLLASTGSTANDYLFTGEQYDGSLGLYYLRARYLNAGTGRFWTRDTHPGNNQEPLSLHRYLYAQADPVNRIDPSGNFTSAISFNISANTMIGLAAFSAAAVVEAKTRAIGNLLVATTGAAGELLDEASIAAQNAIAAAEAALLTQYRSFEEAASKARDLLRNLGQTLKTLKVVPVSQTVMPDVANHVSTAQAAGHPIMLTRVSGAQAKINRRAALAGRGPAGLGNSWDEYPFASGRLPGSPPPSVVPVPALQNLIQGGVIAISYKLEKINVGDNYFVVVIP